jgi:hypothetical protein
MYSRDLDIIIRLCLTVDPKLRPDCDKLITHPLIKKNLG